MNDMNVSDFLETTPSGDYSKEAVDQYLSELMSDFSRVKSVMQKHIDDARSEEADKVTELQDMLERIEAERSELEGKLADLTEEKYEEIKQKQIENENLSSDLDSLRSAYDDLKRYMDESESSSASAEDSDVQSEDDSGETYYDTSLMTQNGFDLLKMLRAMSGNAKDPGSAVEIKKIWEEEESETIPAADDRGGHILRNTKRKTEVSVKYIAGDEMKRE